MGISLVFSPTATWPITTPFGPWVVADSRWTRSPCLRAPRISLPSMAAASAWPASRLDHEPRSWSSASASSLDRTRRQVSFDARATPLSARSRACFRAQSAIAM